MNPIRPSLVLAVSCGDPQGIGPEVTVAAVGAFLAGHPEARAILCGDASQLEELAGRALPREPAPGPIQVVDCAYRPDGAPPPSAGAGRAALAALDAAYARVADGRAHALVTAPVSKEAIHRVRPGFHGHTEYLGVLRGAEPVMMLGDDRLRIFLVTDHVPLAKVSEHLTAARLRRVLTVAHAALRETFGIERPRIAVLGLNPHAGEGGTLGTEERDRIAPLIAELGGREAGFDGPVSADSFFCPGRHDRYDGVVALYHDQGLIPLKALSFGRAVNVTLGLDITRTSPDHGVAFDLVGQGRADPASMTLALEWAARAVSGSRS